MSVSVCTLMQFLTESKKQNKTIQVEAPFQVPSVKRACACVSVGGGGGRAAHAPHRRECIDEVKRKKKTLQRL